MSENERNVAFATDIEAQQRASCPLVSHSAVLRRAEEIRALVRCNISEEDVEDFFLSYSLQTGDVIVQSCAAIEFLGAPCWTLLL